ncbi:hypothetical protein PYCC9005_002157 [Savitreella phatthalungensis]
MFLSTSSRISPKKLSFVTLLIGKATSGAGRAFTANTARMFGCSRRTHSLQRRSLLAQAHVALAQQDLSTARELFERLTKETDDRADAYYNLGVVDWLQRRPQRAVEQWKRALECHNPDAKNSKLSEGDLETLSSCHVNMANYYLLVEPSLGSAIDHLRHASELKPGDGEIHYNYGLALERDGQLELALENYLRAEELGIKKSVDTLIRNVGAKLIKRNSTLPISPQEVFENAKARAEAIDHRPKSDDIMRDGARGDNR